LLIKMLSFHFMLFFSILDLQQVRFELAARQA